MKPAILKEVSNEPRSSAPPGHFRPAFVVPTLNEEHALPKLIASLRRTGTGTPDHTELVSPHVFVADGGSRDTTRDVAARLGARVVAASPGRGSQIRQGAEAAWKTGATVVVIAHADTRVPADLMEHLEAAYRNGAVGGGCLLRFDPAPGLLRYAAPLVNWRTRRFEVPLGDQLQWVTREAWKQIDGIRPWPILEDLDLIRRLRRVGKIAILPCVAVTDARRFVERGPLRTVATNWLIWTLFALGVPPRRLSSLYRNIR